VRPVLFHWHGRNVYGYATMLYLGLVAGVYLGALLARGSADRFALATIALLVPALVGARLWFVLGNWDVFRHAPASILRHWQGGAALYGGLVIAVPLSVPLLRAVGPGFLPFWDAASFTMVVGLAFTRVGCLLNGCCAGRETSGRLGLALPGADGVRRRVPTQLLELGWALLLLAVLVLVRSRLPAGGVFLLAVAGYSGGRFALERTRERSEPATQLASAGLALGAGAWLLVGMAG
jgi:phosphatidylglycerol---prolipoprotein diacylglyceryl transferase